MTRRLYHTIATLVLLLAGWPALGHAAAVDIDSPIGRWQTYDDRTHQARGMVRIFEKDGKLFGRIERRPEKRDPSDLCTACNDERKDQPIDGLVIIRNMSKSDQDPLEWVGGDVVDPDTGRVYRFRMRVEDRGETLVVRGFFGVSLLGRTQTWKRIP
jgi:uncharacterized protein (DUF2147 family)